MKFDDVDAITNSYFAANDKIDALAGTLPKKLTRPTIMVRSDREIPLIRIQVIPVDSNFIDASTITSKIIRRRLEQIPGIGFVDVNGLQDEWYSIRIDTNSLNRYNITDLDVVKAVKKFENESGTIKVEDGIYAYDLKIRVPFKTVESILSMPIKLVNGNSIQIKEIADVVKTPSPERGSHLFGEKRAIVISIYPQGGSRIPKLLKGIDEELKRLSEQYPSIKFTTTQNQSNLLDLSIQNLEQGILWGSISAFFVLFLFARGWREPVIIGINLPLALLLSVYALYMFDVSINIISLGGLTLGLGMMIDNCIVVIDNISQHMLREQDLISASIKGTEEVMLPIIGSTLTNIAVFVPILILNGIYGELLYDQAITIAIVLAVSMLSTFILTPLFFATLFRNTKTASGQNSALFHVILTLHDALFNFFWKRKGQAIVVAFVFLCVAVFLIFIMDKTSLPEIDRTETAVSLDWNEPLSAEGNRVRMMDLMSELNKKGVIAEADIGVPGFLLAPGLHSIQHTELYINCLTPSLKNEIDEWLIGHLSQKFPRCIFRLHNALNPFDQVVDDEKPNFEVRIRNSNQDVAIDPRQLDSVFFRLKTSFPTARKSNGFRNDSLAILTINQDLISRYKIDYASIVAQLKLTFQGEIIADLSSLGTSKPLLAKQHEGELAQILHATTVQVHDGLKLSLSSFVNVETSANYGCITSDRAGVYYAIDIESGENSNTIMEKVREICGSRGVLVSFTGKYLETNSALFSVVFTMAVSLVLIYLILAAEFESVKIPILVILVLPLGLSGALILLWISGGSINVMSGVGLVIAIGVLDNDIILKLDRINRLRNTLGLEKAIIEAGRDRLKPIILNTCTNIVALIPIIFTSGLGSDLQRPIAITSIGGLFVGTFVALYIIPIIYWYFSGEKRPVTESGSEHE